MTTTDTTKVTLGLINGRHDNINALADGFLVDTVIDDVFDFDRIKDIIALKTSLRTTCVSMLASQELSYVSVRGTVTCVPTSMLSTATLIFW